MAFHQKVKEKKKTSQPVCIAENVKQTGKVIEFVSLSYFDFFFFLLLYIFL